MADVQNNTSATATRLRKYPPNSKGPYFIYVRKKDVNIDPLKVQKYVFKTYKSCVKAFCVNEFKLKFEFIDVLEVNDMVLNLNLMDYKVYVPADQVEVRGVVNLAVSTDIRTLIQNSFGGFTNPNIEKVKILEMYRFINTEKKEPMNRVKVTFEGTVLPDHIIVDSHLIIRIHPFHPKPIFCGKCLAYNHSASYCTKYRQKCR